VVLASPIYFGPELAAGRLVQPFETLTDYSPGIWLVYPTDRRRSPKITAFRDWLLDVVAHDPVIARHRDH
jgi:LysR family glycine cleavage system transcriptional activator